MQSHTEKLHDFTELKTETRYDMNVSLTRRLSIFTLYDAHFLTYKTSSKIAAFK